MARGGGIINIAGEKLTDQELRNAIYTGPWLADAKRWFSKTKGPAHVIGEKYLNGSHIWQFTDSEKPESYERQTGVCHDCNEHFVIGQMEADHIEPWHKGGKTVPENCQMRCMPCNRTKGGK